MPKTLADFVEPLADDAPEPIRRTSRQIVSVTTLVAPRDRDRLRMLSLTTGLSLQQMGLEAWSMWLEARGLQPLKPVTANRPSGLKR